MAKQQKIYPVNDNYRIKSDAHCLILEAKNSKGNRGEETYHPTLESLLGAMYEREVRHNLDDLEKMREFKDEIISKMNELIQVKRGEYE